MTGNNEALWRALQPLRSVACWLMTGAHPDDEWSGFLAWLALGRGVRTVYACSTRGEGGQNALGPERGRLLAALRSREMERAAGEIGLALRWIGAGPEHGADDPVFDFGFSKSGEDTLRRWGAERLRERLVRLIRTERPDAVSPTFLDVPGQHGHHRAMTAATLEAVELAADAGFAGGGLPAWRVAKLYLPAFSGAGGSYDDEVPPPPETVRVDLGARCDALGASWAQVGERSRRWHASQGMGRDLADGSRPFPLHLLRGVPDAAAPLDGVAHRLGDLADVPALRVADAAIAAALAAFPDRGGVAEALHRALAALQGAVVRAEIAPRIALKRRQLSAAVTVALRIGAEVVLSPPQVRAGERAVLSIRAVGGAVVEPRVPAGWRAQRLDGERFAIEVPRDAAPMGTLRDGFDPLGGNEPVGAALLWTHQGSAWVLACDPPGRLTVAPLVDVAVAPGAVVRRVDSAAPVVVALDGVAPPDGWPVLRRDAAGYELAVSPGRHDLAAGGVRLAWLRGAPAGEVAIVEPAVARVLRVPVAIDGAARVGVIAGEADETLGWLRQLDINAVAVDDATLAGGDLGRFDVLLVGVFGFGQRRVQPDRLMAWVAAGGSLVTLYHRPGDGWDEGRTPPLPITIGSPSLRWRVTDPSAPVGVLLPGHPLLNHPNTIGAADWEGWVRERGLYFARSWDPAYAALLELSDPGEAPMQGALLAAAVGKGRHVHVALALHHQFSALVPGAFRLLANLVARPAAAPPGA